VNLKDDLVYLIGGAALGAVLGAIGGWFYARVKRNPEAGVSDAVQKASEIDRGQLFGLGMAVIRVVRALAEMM
jgi:hypothetical protein